MSLLLHNNVYLNNALLINENELKVTKAQLETTIAELAATKTELDANKAQFQAENFELQTKIKELGLASSSSQLASWQQLKSSAGFKVNLLVKLFRDDIDAKLRKNEETNKSFEILVNELQEKIKNLLDNWSDSISDINISLDLQLEVLDVFLKHTISVININGLIIQHVSKLDLPFLYKDYLKKYVEVEHINKRLIKSNEYHQKVIDLLASVVSSLNQRLGTCILKFVGDGDLLVAEDYMIVEFQTNKLVDKSLSSPSYYFNEKSLIQNSGVWDILSVDKSESLNFPSRNVKSDLNIFIVMILFPNLPKETIETKLKEYDVEFESLLKNLPAQVDFINKSKNVKDVIDLTINVFKCVTKVLIDNLIEDCINNHISEFKLSERFASYLWKYMRLKRLDDSCNKLNEKVKHYLDVCSKEIFRLNKIFWENMDNGYSNIDGYRFTRLSTRHLNNPHTYLYYFSSKMLAKQVKDKWITFNENNYLIQKNNPISISTYVPGFIIEIST